jgi:hypothetical protein
MLLLVGHDKTKARCVYQETRHAVLYQKIKTTHALVGASSLVIVSMLIVMHGMPPELCEPPSCEPFQIEADMWLVRVKAATCILTWPYISPSRPSNRF